MTVELFGRPWCWRNKCIARTQTVKPVQCVTALHCIPNNLNPDSLWTAEVISLLQYFKIQTKLTTGMSTLLLHASCLETFQGTTFKTFFTIFTQLLPLLCHTSTKQHIYWWTSSSVTFQNIFHWYKNQRFPSRNSSIFPHYFCMHMYVVTKFLHVIS